MKYWNCMAHVHWSCYVVIWEYESFRGKLIVKKRKKRIPCQVRKKEHISSIGISSHAFSHKVQVIYGRPRSVGKKKSKSAIFRGLELDDSIFASAWNFTCSVFGVRTPSRVPGPDEEGGKERRRAKFKANFFPFPLFFQLLSQRLYAFSTVGFGRRKEGKKWRRKLALGAGRFGLHFTPSNCENGQISFLSLYI